jgi:hypothetical protein
MDVNQLRGKAVDLENAQKGMKKKVNPKAISIIDGYVSPNLPECIIYPV